MPPLTVRYPVPTPEDDLDAIVAGLEEGWAPEPEQWPVEKAARLCPVFRFLIGGRS